MTMRYGRCSRQLSSTHYWPVVILVVAVAATAHAQVTTGTILGTVTDTSGGVLPGASVTITNTATGLARTVTSSSEGTFLAPALPPGTYRVDVTFDGFGPFAWEGGLEVGQNRRVDAQLKTGAISEQVTVTAGALYVDTQSSSIGIVVDSKRMEELPLINRSALSLVTLGPGVATATLPTIVIASTGQPTLSAGGARLDQNSIILDGAELSGGWLNNGQNLPSPDSLQEFQVLTSTYGAEYGRATGAALTAITKSGTNALHGGLWEYFRDDALNAKNFFAPTKPYLRQHQFGGNLGGPVIRNRTFFFGNYEGIRLDQQQILRLFPSTAAERAGDFSASTRPIIDPLTGQPFPGNRIPLERIDPLARGFLEAYLPLPNQGAEYVALRPRPTNVNQFTVKVDHKFTDSNTLAVRWWRSRAKGLTGPVPALEIERSYPLQATTVSNTHVFRNNLVGEGRVSYSTALTFDPAHPASKTPRELGARYDQDGPAPLPPGVIVSGAFSANQIRPWSDEWKMLNFDYKMTWVTGRHTIKFGFEGWRQFETRNIQFLTSGIFVFAGLFTGNPLADLMLGRPVAFTQQSVLGGEMTTHTWAGFVQDDVKLGRRLTVNLGLRYDVTKPWSTVDRGSGTFRRGQQSTRYPNAPPGLVFPGDAGVPDGLFFTDKNNFAPRVGFAWDVRGDGRTALRGGYGIFYTPIAAYDVLQSNEVPPFTQRISFTPLSMSDPYSGRTSPFPYTASPSGGALFAFPMQISSIDPHLQIGYLHQYNVNVQQQFGQDLIVQAGYFGSLGRKLLSLREINAAVFGPGATAANAQQRRPYLPQFFAGIDGQFSDARSEYHSLQVSATKKYARGYTVQLAYTLAKSMDDCSTIRTPCLQNPSRPLSNEWARSDFDRRHVLRVNGIWESPRMQESPLLGHVLGGWRLAGIMSALSGLPYTVTSGADIALIGPGLGTAQQRPNVVGDPELDSDRPRDERIQRYFNTAAFENPPLGEFSNTRRNLLTGPGSFNVDASLSKRFEPWSGARDRRIEFRLEVFNLFNTVNLSNPVAVRTSPVFGSIRTAGDARVVQLGLRFDF